MHEVAVAIVMIAVLFAENREIHLRKRHRQIPLLLIYLAKRYKYLYSWRGVRGKHRISEQGCSV